MSDQTRARPRREPWVRMRIRLAEDVAVQKLGKWVLNQVGLPDTSEGRGLARCIVVGMLHAVFGKFHENARGKILPDLDASDVDDWVPVPGFGQQLVAEGWLLEEYDGLRIVDPANYIESWKENREKQTTQKRRTRAAAKANADRHGPVPTDNSRTSRGTTDGRPLSASVSDSVGLEEGRATIIEHLVSPAVGLDLAQWDRIAERIDDALSIVGEVYVEPGERYRAVALAIEARLHGHDPNDDRKIRGLWFWLTGSGGADLIPSLRAKLHAARNAG